MVLISLICVPAIHWISTGVQDATVESEEVLIEIVYFTIPSEIFDFIPLLHTNKSTKTDIIKVQILYEEDIISSLVKFAFV